MKKLILLFFIFLGLSLSAQDGNIFHNRDFWSLNPSIKVIEKNITLGNDINALNSSAFDGVTYALLEKVNNHTIKYLLSKKGNGVNKLTHDGRTYIFWAAYKNNLEMMKYLVSQGAKTDIVDSHGYSILNFAAATGQTNTKLYDYLFHINADITVEKNHDGANALLLIAPHLENYSLINYFLTKGASLNDKDGNGNGIFEYAAKGGNTSFLKILIDNGVEKSINAMIFASQGLRRKKNTLETYTFLEKLGVKVNAIDKNGRNPLHAIAYSNKDLAIYKYFLSKGVSVNLQDKEGRTPFMNAANNNDLEVLKLLVKEVKNINLKDKNGRTALTMAVNRNNINVIKFLLKKGADINTIDNNNNTLSYYLINNFKKGKEEVFEDKLKILENQNLVINKLQNKGNTLLHIAVKKNNLTLLRRLAKFNIDVNIKNEAGLSALQIAAMRSRDDKIIKYLLSIGANKNIKTDFNETVYDLASENELLKKQNINITFLK